MCEGAEAQGLCWMGSWLWWLFFLDPELTQKAGKRWNASLVDSFIMGDHSDSFPDDQAQPITEGTNGVVG